MMHDATGVSTEGGGTSPNFTLRLHPHRCISVGVPPPISIGNDVEHLVVPRDFCFPFISRHDPTHRRPHPPCTTVPVESLPASIGPECNWVRRRKAEPVTRVRQVPRRSGESPLDLGSRCNYDIAGTRESKTPSYTPHFILQSLQSASNPDFGKFAG
jgi:hypothetical protein